MIELGIGFVLGCLMGGLCMSFMAGVKLGSLIDELDHCQRLNDGWRRLAAEKHDKPPFDRIEGDGPVHG